MDGQPEFATWRIGWHEQGLAFEVLVTGKTQPPRCNPLDPGVSSKCMLWIDTRATQNVHRATRFCHRFALLPTGRGGNKQQPAGFAVPLGPEREGRALRIARQLRSAERRLPAPAWLPAESLAGYDPEAQPRLGFYGVVRDDELGVQPLTVGDEFPYHSDPSLWQTLELMPA